MASSIRNIVKGTLRSRIIATKRGSFSAPSSRVMKTTFCVVGTERKTGTLPVLVSLIGLSAGGAGVGFSGVRPHLDQSAASVDIPPVAAEGAAEAPAPTAPAVVPVVVPAAGAAPPLPPQAVASAARASAPAVVPRALPYRTTVCRSLPDVPVRTHAHTHG